MGHFFLKEILKRNPSQTNRKAIDRSNQTPHTTNNSGPAPARCTLLAWWRYSCTRAWRAPAHLLVMLSVGEGVEGGELARCNKHHLASAPANCSVFTFVFTAQPQKTVESRARYRDPVRSASVASLFKSNPCLQGRWQKFCKRSQGKKISVSRISVLSKLPHV